MNPFKGMTKEELLGEAQRYRFLFKCSQKMNKSKAEKIAALEAQLAARNQAAEAMGVLERLVKHQGSTHVTLYHNDGLRIFGIETREDDGLCDYRGNDLIEAVLKAGGEG